MKNAYRYLTLCLLLLFVGCSTDVQRQENRPAAPGGAGTARVGVVIDLRPLQEKFEPGDSVIFSAAIRNVGMEPVSYLESTPERDLWLLVDDSNFSRVPMTRLGVTYENRQRSPYTRRVLVKLLPGEEQVYHINVSRFYDMSLPGKYSVQAKMQISPTPSAEFENFVKSNRAEIEVLRGRKNPE